MIFLQLCKGRETILGEWTHTELVSEKTPNVGPPPGLGPGALGRGIDGSAVFLIKHLYSDLYVK